jgi:DNA invertase Pin-like site-specific DNA recombinase
MLLSQLNLYGSTYLNPAGTLKLELGQHSRAFNETASGAKEDRSERQWVMALAQARKIDTILVSELTGWDRSMMDLVQTLQLLQSWRVSILALSGVQFDLTTPYGKMVALVMASPAEFERNLLREPCGLARSARPRRMPSPVRSGSREAPFGRGDRIPASLRGNYFAARSAAIISSMAMRIR